MSPADWLFQAFIYFPSSIIVGALALFGVWWTLSGQLKMQWDEWDRREATFQKQLQVREQSDREGQERRFTAAVRTVAIEAVNNAVALLSFCHLAKKYPFVPFSTGLTREQFDNQLPLFAERLSPAHLQQTATVYMEAFRYKVVVEYNVARSARLSEQQIKDASNLSLGFSVIFRTLALSVFDREQLHAFETILLIADVPPS
jgi:hypothetical protein